MYRLALLALFLLAACASPTPRYAGKARVAVQIDGSRFVLFRRGAEVEAYRVSREDRPSETGVLLKAGRAIEALTRCPIASGSLTGDQAIVRAEVDCDRSRQGPAGTRIDFHGIFATCVISQGPILPNDWLPAAEVDCLLDWYPYFDLALDEI